jgi:hypothetical protein
MSQDVNSSSSNFLEPPIQIEGSQPIFIFSSFSGSQGSSLDSQETNINSFQKPASTYDLSNLFDAL